MTDTRRSPQLAGQYLFDYGPMLSGALYRTMNLDQIISAMNDVQQRLFAIDCAERVLPHYEEGNPSDNVPRLALMIARRYAEGQATMGELNDALAALCSSESPNEFERFTLLPHDDSPRLAWKAALRAVMAAWFPDIRVRSTVQASERAAGDSEQDWQRQRALWYLTGQH